ncbi:hypothetical protein NU08_3289 [Flavobacterium anhuiense]|uniref:Uncharacterized protein n=1 Tax=Flavobacterium anhuiense TaxID=459526 RepID=A0A444VVR4_9FLAO|nr:hypothetical protein NU08_3289 [Flavobacterium anhuiense]
MSSSPSNSTIFFINSYSVSLLGKVTSGCQRREARTYYLDSFSHLFNKYKKNLNKNKLKHVNSFFH